MTSIGLSVPFIILAIAFPVVVIGVITQPMMVVRYNASFLYKVLMLLIFIVAFAACLIASDAHHQSTPHMVGLMVVFALIMLMIRLRPFFTRKLRYQTIKECLTEIPARKQAKVTAFIAKHQLIAESTLADIKVAVDQAWHLALEDYDDVTFNQPVLVGVSGDMLWYLVSAVGSESSDLYFKKIARCSYNASEWNYDKAFAVKGLLNGILPRMWSLPVTTKKFAKS